MVKFARHVSTLQRNIRGVSLVQNRGVESARDSGLISKTFHGFTKSREAQWLYNFPFHLKVRIGSP